MEIMIKIIIITAKITIIRKYTYVKSSKYLKKIIECFLYDEEFFASCCLVC